MNRPFVILASAACLGIIFGKYTIWDFSAAYLLAVIFLLASLILSFRRESGILIILSIFFSSTVLFLNSIQPAKCDIVNFIPPKNQRCLVSGLVAGQPHRRGEYCEFIFKAQEIDSASLRHSCCGNILVKVRSAADFSPGQALLLAGRLHKPYLKFKNKTQNYQKYLRSRDIYTFMDIDSDIEVSRLANRSIFKNNFSYRFKLNAQTLINRYLEGLSAEVLEAMVLGDKENLSKKLVNSMVLSGTVHILVVSGFNVGIVCFIAVLILKIFRLPRKIRLVITAIATLFYCLVTGSSIPVVRATLMAQVFLFSYFFKRQVDIYNCLALAAFAIIIFNPRQLDDLGFQLSFISVFFIVYFFPLLKNKLPLEAIKSKTALFFIEGALVSFSAWMGTAGIIAYNFRTFSPITVIANIFIVPLASMITLCGFGIVIFGNFFPILGKLFAVNAKALIVLLFLVNDYLVRIPGAYYKF